MDTKKKVRLVIAIVLSVLTAAFIVWIFSNSLKVAVESAAQSDSVTQKLQRVFQVLLPNSSIATATGEAFDELENLVRVLAHYAEYAVLGALAFCTYRAFTDEKIWAITPFCCVVAVSAVDEVLQIFTEGRAFQWTDILIDCAGAWTGCLVALGVVALGVLIVRLIKNATQPKRKKV